MDDVALTRARNRRALTAFLVVVSLGVGAISGGVVWLQRQYLHEKIRGDMRTELALIGEAILESLLRSDYAAVERLARTWVENHDDRIEIAVVMPNGFVLAEYRKAVSPRDSLTVEQPVEFDGRVVTTLRAVSDVSLRASGLQAIVFYAWLACVAVIALLGWALWATLERTAIRPLTEQVLRRELKERQLEQRGAELEAAVRELETFSYSVSHDLRAPLRAIDGFSHALLSDYAATLDDKGRHYLSRIRSGAQRMAELIDDLLNLAQITRGELRTEPIDLSDLTRGIIEELRKRDRARAVTVNLPDRLLVRGDRRLVTVAMVNLLGNAWKFTGKRADAVITVGREQDGPETVWFVRDNGAGFDMAYVNKLFTPFQRLHKASEFEGTGIGLAIVQRIVARHGGRVWATAAVDEGATFYLTLGDRQ
ncbi:MAG: sensor histidine kinase [Nitrospirota bacterium]